MKLWAQASLAVVAAQGSSVGSTPCTEIATSSAAVIRLSTPCSPTSLSAGSVEKPDLELPYAPGNAALAWTRPSNTSRIALRYWLLVSRRDSLCAGYGPWSQLGASTPPPTPST